MEVARLLIQHWVDVEKAMDIAAIPLIMAAQKGHAEMAEIMLQHGADVDKAKADGQTRLTKAADKSHPAIVRVRGFLAGMPQTSHGR